MSMFTSSSPGIVAGAENQGAGLISLTSKATWGDTNDNTSWASNSVTTTSGALYLLGVVHCVASGTIANMTGFAGGCISAPARVHVQSYNGNLQLVELWVAKGTGSSSVVTATFPVTRTGVQVQMMECTNVNLALGLTISGTTYGVIQHSGTPHVSGDTGYPQTSLTAFANANNGVFCVVGMNYVPASWDPPGANPPLIVSRQASITSPDSTIGTCWAGVPVTNPVMTPTRISGYEAGTLACELASV